MKIFSGFRAAFASAWDAFWNSRGWASIGGTATTSRENVSEDSALNWSAIWCATRLMSGVGAALPLPIFSGRESEARTKERKHPAWRLLNGAPNPEMTAFNFRSVMWQWQLNWGNAYAEIVREGNDPDGDLVALWPIHPTRVELEYDDNDVLLYRVRNKPGKPDSYLEAWQMFHVSSIITGDGVCGHGIIEHARETIGAGIAAEKYGANFFGGAAVPRAVIEHDTNWNVDQRDAFRREWDEIYSGPDGKRVAVLGGGAKMKALSLSAEDSQFLETRQFSVEEVARWYGIPPHLLQHLLRATFDNIENLGISFVQYSLIPWLRIWEQTIWHKLFTESEREDLFAEHNVDALLRGDTAARGEFYRALITLAIATRNEIRKLENMDPVDGGNTFLVQGATVALGDDGKPESDFATPNTPGDQDPPPESTGRAVLSNVSSHLNRIISHDLSRFLTKESKAIANFAKKPDEFMQLVDKFYAEHSTIVRDEMTETLGALSVCGAATDIDQFVSSWVSEGKALVIEASGTAKRDELPGVIQSAIESRTWTERPLRAVEGIKNAIVSV